MRTKTCLLSFSIAILTLVTLPDCSVGQQPYSHFANTYSQATQATRNVPAAFYQSMGPGPNIGSHSVMPPSPTFSSPLFAGPASSAAPTYATQPFPQANTSHLNSPQLAPMKRYQLSPDSTPAPIVHQNIVPEGAYQMPAVAQSVFPNQCDQCEQAVGMPEYTSDGAPGNLPYQANTCNMKNYLANIGGGRSFFKALVDSNWTRVAMVYGGFGNVSNRSGNIFDGQASSDTGIIGFDIGRRHSPSMRSSFDFTYRGGDVEADDLKVGELSVYSIMKNLHFDLPTKAQFRPYVGAGIGLAGIDAHADIAGNSYSADETSFAYQFIGGVARNISHNASLYAEYRYFSLSDVDVFSSAGRQEGSFASHDVLFGLRMGF